MPFEPAEDYLAERGDRLVISLSGPDKYGKTHTFWTFPGPWWMIDLDMGCDESLKHAVELGLVDLKDVHVAGHLIDENVGSIPKNYLVSKEGETDTQASARFEKEATDHYRYLKGMLDPINDDYVAALEAADAVGGSVCVDPASKWWTLVSAIKNFETEVLKARKWHRERKALADDRRDFGLANATMDGLMLRAMHLPRVNVLFIQKAAAEYERDEEKKEQVGSKLETVYRANGYRGAGSIAQASLMLKHNDEGDIVARVDSARFKRELVGAEIVEPTYDNIREVLFG